MHITGDDSKMLKQLIAIFQKKVNYHTLNTAEVLTVAIVLQYVSDLSTRVDKELESIAKFGSSPVQVATQSTPPMPPTALPLMADKVEKVVSISKGKKKK